MSVGSGGEPLWQPGRLVSLWDMLEIDMRGFMSLAREIEAQDAVFCTIDIQNESAIESGKAPDQKLTTEESEEMVERLAKMAEFAKNISLPVSHDLLQANLEEPPKTLAEWRMLIRAIYSEMKNRQFLYMPAHRARFFKMQFRDATVYAFPFSAKELQLAARCISVGMFTASVFHSMRAGERGVRALSAALGVDFSIPPDLATWHDHQVKIGNAIAAIKQRPKTTERDQDLEFFSKSATQLQYFNDGWRIRVAHSRASYEEGDAISALTHVTALIDELATRLKEPA